MSSDNPSRKYHDKEAFVTGHSGTTPHEILLLCMTIPIGLHLYYKLLPFVGRSKTKSIMLEFVVLILPMIVVQTSLLPVSGYVSLLLGMLLLAYLLSAQLPKSNKSSTKNSEETKRPIFLSIHRSSVYLLTTVAILAVDFPIFPRKYCKTEVSGYGWMDLGAASFVIIAGWTSSLSSLHNLQRKSTYSTPYRAIKKCAPLFLLGVIRLATNKGLEYQEHVSEYGVHWNFFFTLCFMEGFMVVWKRIKSVFAGGMWTDGIVAMGSMITYQVFLVLGGQDFIENGERRCTSDYNEPWTMCDVFYANREGILGLIGYVGVRLLSEDIGRFCFLSVDQSKLETAEVRQQRLVMTAAFLWVTHLGLTTIAKIPTSRRSTNLPFILWALAHNMTILFLINYATMTFSRTHDNKPPRIPYILGVVNRYGLAVFLLSNILTGLVNLTVDTLHASDAKALVILSVYVGLVCGSAVILDNIFNKRKEG